jgi:hypothetical protein
MIRFRVDDYPGTKPAEFGKHNLDNFKKFHELMTRHGASQVLGVIPVYTSDEALQWMGKQDNIEVALHGVNHDERFPNEFRDHITEREVYLILSNEKHIFEEETGKPVSVYIPPHNVVDVRTVNALSRAGFKTLYGGPESDVSVLDSARALGMNTVRHMPPFYARSDEMMAGNLHGWIRSHPGDFDLALHWTWEMNIGLDNLDNFLSQLHGII